MASTATSTYLPPLDVPHEREGIGRELEVVEPELVNLSLIGQQLHSAMFGPLSRSIHLQLAGLVESRCGLAGTVAERALAHGFVPEGQRRLSGWLTADPGRAGDD